jgi:hypothetical protein
MNLIAVPSLLYKANVASTLDFTIKEIEIERRENDSSAEKYG